MMHCLSFLRRCRSRPQRWEISRCTAARCYSGVLLSPSVGRGRCAPPRRTEAPCHLRRGRCPHRPARCCIGYLSPSVGGGRLCPPVYFLGGFRAPEGEILLFPQNRIFSPRCTRLRISASWAESSALGSVRVTALLPCPPFSATRLPPLAMARLHCSAARFAP